MGLNPNLQMGNWSAERGLEPGLRPLLSGLRDCPGPTSTVILTAAFGCCPHADHWCHQTLAPGTPEGVLWPKPFGHPCTLWSGAIRIWG